MSNIVLENVMVVSTRADLAKKEMRVAFSLGLDENTLEQVNKLGILAVNEVPVTIVISPMQTELPYTDADLKMRDQEEAYMAVSIR